MELKTFRNVLALKAWNQNIDALAIIEINSKFLKRVNDRCKLFRRLIKRDNHLEELTYSTHDFYVYYKHNFISDIWNELDAKLFVWCRFLTVNTYCEVTTERKLAHISEDGISWRFYDCGTGRMYFTDLVFINQLNKCLSPVQMLIDLVQMT